MRTVDGNTTEPGYTFIADPDTGLYRPGANRLRVVTGATDQWEVDASGHFWPVVDNARDLGKSGNEIRDVYLDGTLKGAGGEPVAYTPALTAATVNPTLGAGATTQGFSVKVGRMVDVWGSIIFGTGAASGTGAYRVSLPFAPSTALYGGNRGTALGSLSLFDNSTNAQRYAFSRYGGATFTNGFMPDPTNASVATTDAQLAATVPWTFSDGDEIHWLLRYVTAL